MTLLLFLAGLVLLIVGADLLVRGASKLALSFGIAPLVVGLTVVAFGTSAPELAVSVKGAFSGQVDVAMGNVVGSNIFNVLFILGISALITPLLVNQQLIRQEVPIMIGVSLLLFAVAYDGTISFGDGVLFCSLLGVYLWFLYRQSRGKQSDALEAEFAEGIGTAEDARKGWDGHWAIQLSLVAVGLVLLVWGADWFVSSAVSFARALGVSEVVIGLTIVAAGTSMPEVATSVMASIRGQRDIAVGNVIGSNIFNILAVLGISALVAPGVGLPVAPSLIAFDLLVMVAVAVACLPIFFTGNLLSRWEGGVFFGMYIAYTSYLILYARQHAVLDEFSAVMTWAVLPLVALTIIVVALRELKERRRVP
ncbi:MAG: calcium/sodium antiporter [Xanthomonadales bacterium]|jgi:cation:H+ antiporter|nr:calcium/sodium antiporter [Xanthomonadales bacterium]